MENTSFAERVSVNLKKLRAATGKSLLQVSKETHLAYSFLNEIESMKKTPSLRTLDTLAEYYNVDPSELVKPKDKQQT